MINADGEEGTGKFGMGRRDWVTASATFETNSDSLKLLSRLLSRSVQSASSSRRHARCNVSKTMEVLGLKINIRRELFWSLLMTLGCGLWTLSCDSVPHN